MPTQNIAKKISKKVANPFKLDYSSVIVAYVSKEGLWRGFVMPYDITYEADSRQKVVTVLRKMLVQYEKGLKRYNHPAHLLTVPLSDKEDQAKLSKISMELVNGMLTKKLKNVGADFYAEAKLPA